MAIFYRGAGINTYWYLNDPMEQGFVARAPENDIYYNTADASYCEKHCE